MLVSYPALFYYESNQKIPFFVTFPDFGDGATQGKDKNEALIMASDWLGIAVANQLIDGTPLPAVSSLDQVSLAKNTPYPDDVDYDQTESFKQMIQVNTDDFLNGDVNARIL